MPSSEAIESWNNMRAFLDGDGEVGALMRTKDWTSTSLGPPDAWPQSLRTVVRIMLTSRYAMWIGWGPDLAFLYNDAYAHMTLGAKHPWALGRRAREVWAEIWPQIGPRIERVLTTGEATWDEGLMLFLERSGYREETYHTFSYSPLPGDDGTIAGNFCVVTEETDRIIGERRLASLRTLAAGLATANTEPDVVAAVEHTVSADARDMPFAMMYLFDDTGTHARLAARAGIPPAHPAARAQVLVHASDAIWPFADILSGAGIVTVDHPAGTVPFPSGPWDRAPARALVVPIAPQGQARPTAAFIAGVNPYRPLDETYRSFISLFVGQVAAGLANARVYEEERQRAEALAAIDRAKTAFFSNVSHEFRTPLTLMLGPTEDALAGEGMMRRDELETVYRNELRLLKLVNSLLDFSRMEAGRTRAHYAPVDLAGLTRDLASTFRSAIERGGLVFEVEAPPLPQPVFDDRQMWEKIVLNLLSNAFKFTLDGHIRVRLRAEPDHVTLSVEDSGVGIPVEEQPRVFERFHRIEGSRARTHEGSGIGLALVQDLVGLHGGGISVESQEGKGTIFTVALPFGNAHLPPDQIGASSERSATAIGAEAFVAEAERWLDAPRASGEDAGAVYAEPPSSAERARIVLADASRAKDEFLAMLGHELRNPLAPILTALQLMRLRAGDALGAERTVIERQTRHLVRLVDDLLDVSRIARGKIELRRERLHVADAVAKGIEMASPLLEERNHALSVDVPRDLTADGDPARLAQVVGNLLTNAAKYTEAGGRVSVTARRTGDEIVLRVRDSGIGIEPAMLPRVFDMFTQERQTLERSPGGLGLGLTIVRNLVALHGGTVEASSEGRGHGSEFIVRLPVVEETARHVAAVGGSPAAVRPVSDVSVLVVDDNEDAAEMLAEYVGSLGYRVRSAFDGPSALRAAEQLQPAIALLDIGLPVMDGFELARRLREAEAHAAIKLVAITGYGQEADRERSRQAGFDAHLVKPVDMEHLEQLLQELSTAVGA
jgi:signal transduction histidine kinase/ActR/RegA family two-component response regulator